MNAPFNAAAEQPTPHGSGTPIVDLVKQDLETRAQAGQLKYGERLKAHNGRNALLDAYQEALDQAMYLRQAMEENGLRVQTAEENRQINRDLLKFFCVSLVTGFIIGFLICGNLWSIGWIHN